MSQEPEIKITEVSAEIKLPAILDLTQAENLIGIFGPAIAIGQDVMIDASKVERLSTGVIQILMAAANRITENDLEFLIVNPSEAFNNGISDIGLLPVFSKWSVAS